MTVLEYLQSLDLETRVAVVGCADSALRGIRNLDEQTAAAASFGLWACPDYLARQLGLAFNCNYGGSSQTSVRRHEKAGRVRFQTADSEASGLQPVGPVRRRECREDLRTLVGCRQG